MKDKRIRERIQMLGIGLQRKQKFVSITVFHRFLE